MDKRTYRCRILYQRKLSSFIDLRSQGGYGASHLFPNLSTLLEQCFLRQKSAFPQLLAIWYLLSTIILRFIYFFVY